MNQALGFRRRVLVAACAAFLLAGCGSGVKLTGKLVKDGQPYTPPHGATLYLSFTGGQEGAQETYAAAVNPADGSFVANGVNYHGLPPGRYKVMLNLTPESTDAASLAQMGPANAVFASINGKEFEVSGAAKPLVIDIGAGKITP